MRSTIRTSHLTSAFLTYTPGLLLAAATSAWAADAAPAPPGAAAPPPKPKWETSAGIGVTYSDGNTRNVLITADILTRRKWEQNEIGLGIIGGYGEAEVKTVDPVTGEIDRNMEKNTDFLRGFGQYNRLFTDRFYGYFRADALHDDIANIMYRVTLSPGAGYYFIKEKQTTLSAEIGPGYIFERLYDETNGTYDNNDYATLRLSQRFEHKFSDRARIWEFLEYLPEFADFGNFIINAEVGVEASLTKRMSLRVVAQDTYDNEPAPGRKENDFKLIAGLNYKF
jgi:putative salt-induced outer membrane protein YdiY